MTSTARDQLLFDLFITAREGGINYWASVTAADSEDTARFWATISEHEDGTTWVINRAIIAHGYRLATSSEWSDRLRWSCERPPVVSLG